MKKSRERLFFNIHHTDPSEQRERGGGLTRWRQGSVQRCLSVCLLEKLACLSLTTIIPRPRLIWITVDIYRHAGPRLCEKEEKVEWSAGN